MVTKEQFVDEIKPQSGPSSLIFGIFNFQFLNTGLTMITLVISHPPLLLPPHPEGDVGS